MDRPRRPAPLPPLTRVEKSPRQEVRNCIGRTIPPFRSRRESNASARDLQCCPIYTFVDCRSPNTCDISPGCMISKSANGVASGVDTESESSARLETLRSTILRYLPRGLRDLDGIRVVITRRPSTTPERVSSQGVSSTRAAVIPNPCALLSSRPRYTEPNSPRCAR